MLHFANSSSLNAEAYDSLILFSLIKKRKKKRKEKLTADLIVIPPHAESVPKQTLFCTIPDRPTCRKCSKTNPVLHYSRQTHMQKVFQNKPCFALFQTDPHAESVPKQTLFCTIPDRPTCRKCSKTNPVLHYSRQTHMQKVFQNKPCFALFQTDPHAESVPKQTLFCTIPDRPTCRKCSKTNPVLHYSRQTHMQKVFQNKPCFALFQTDPHAESVPKQTLFCTIPDRPTCRKCSKTNPVLHYSRQTHMQKVFQNKPCFALFQTDPHAENVP